MAKSSGKSRTSRKSAKPKTKARRAAAKAPSRPAAGRSAKKPAKKRGAAAARRAIYKKSPRTADAMQGHEPTKGLYSWITHTDFASRDPQATRDWCISVLGWSFRPPMPMRDGDYHLFAYSDMGGGGIRGLSGNDQPGSMPFVHVENCQASFDSAIRNGAQAVQPPNTIMPGVTLAIVLAPGGVPIGFSGP